MTRREVAKVTKHRRAKWCITFYPTEVHQDNAWLLSALQGIRSTTLRCAVSGTEICPTTGKKHLQAYAEFEAPGATLHDLKDATSTAVHGEPAKGTRVHNYKYCTKDGAAEEYHQGTETADAYWGRTKTGDQGRRSDLIKIRDHFVGGGGIAELVWDDEKISLLTQIRVIPTIQAAVQAREKKCPNQVVVTILYGPGGTGKSSWVQQQWPASSLYIKDPQSEWWDGLDSCHTALWIDEMGYKSKLPMATMKKIMDPECPGIPVNGKNLPTRLHHFCYVFITSNYDPRCGWYKDSTNDSGWMRRADKAIYIGDKIWEMDPPLRKALPQPMPDYLMN